jgi:predicted ATPase
MGWSSYQGKKSDIMIERIKLENFRSIRSLDLELGQLNVLIGRNGAGKSNFLSFFQILGNGVREGLNKTIINEVRGFEFLRHMKAAASESVFWEVTFESKHNERLFYQGKIGSRGIAGYTIQSEILSRPPRPPHDTRYKYLEVRDGRITLLTSQEEEEEASLDNLDQELAISQIRNHARYPALAEAFGHLRTWSVFNGFGERELRNIRGPQTLNVINPLQLAPDGSNLVSVLWELSNQQKYEKTYNRLNEIVRSVFPDFKQFDLPLVAGAQASISFRSIELPESIPALFMSDGQLRFLGLVMLLLLPDSPDLILIDEPEIGMHPKMIDVFAEILQESAQHTQIIVSTHSPQLVDSLRPNDLLIVEREDGETHIRKPDVDRLQHWLERYSPGYLWTNTTLLES